ncbi:MAG: hypothetical protein ACPHRO_02095 [Nannocystaceae bacterium]
MRPDDSPDSSKTSRTEGEHETLDAGGSGERPVNLLHDVTANRRRRLFLRFSVVVALLIISGGGGLWLHDQRRARTTTEALRVATQRLNGGSLAELRQAEGVLRAAGGSVGHDHRLDRALLVIEALRVAEFGEDLQEGRAVVSRSLDRGLTSFELSLAAALYQASDGDFDALEDSRALLNQASRDGAFGTGLAAWPALVLELRSATSKSISDDAVIDAVAEAGGGDARPMAVKRLEITRDYLNGERRSATRALSRLRDEAPTHLGLAADEALLLAVGREQLGAVASISDQLATRTMGLSTIDQGRSSLSRSVVQLYSGDREGAGELVAKVWRKIAPWDRLSRDLALEVAVDAGAFELVDRLLAESGLPEEDIQTYRAWKSFGAGDPAAALGRLAELEQRSPRVAYLQGLALVAQERYEEAWPWLERAEHFFPGRVEIEVAKARVMLRRDDPRTMLRSLEGLAEEEPYAPRAWTALGEARLEVFRAEGGRDLRLALEAQSALEHAVEVEPLPATAHRRLGELWRARMSVREDAATQALTHYRAAASLNPSVSQNRAALASMLMDLGLDEEAGPLIAALIEDDTASTEIQLRQVRLWGRLGATERTADAEALCELAAKRGASPRDVAVARLYMALGTSNEDELGTLVRAARDSRVMGGNDAEWIGLLVRALAQHYDGDEALKVVRRAIRRLPTEQTGRLFLEWARIELRRGNFARGAGYASIGYRRLRDENALPTAQVEAAELAVQGYSYAARAKPAVRISAPLTRRFPMVGKAWQVYALALHIGSESDASLSAVNKAIELAPTLASAYHMRARIQLRRGNRQGARKSMRAAMKLAKGTSAYASYKKSWERLR